MRILLLGEASFVHNTLRQGLKSLGHDVVHASDGNNWHNSSRDIDLRRNMKYGFLGGLYVLWQIARHWKSFIGNDIVQIHNYFFIPMRPGWSAWLLSALKRHNKVIVKGCWGDDPQVIKSQSMGIPEYNDTHVKGKAINTAENKARINEQDLPECTRTWREVTAMSDALVPCLYEYWLNYNTEPFRNKLHYLPLPIEIPDNVKVKGTGDVINVLVGIQPQREYLKGAKYIAALLEQIAKEYPQRIHVTRVEGVPYDEYCRMLDEADVLVDQLYSYTPSMNSLAAMARGTVVIGGGEEDYYKFIGEEELRPIINVRPFEDDENITVLRDALCTPGRITALSRQSIDFVRKHHDHKKVARQYEELYHRLLTEKANQY